MQRFLSLVLSVSLVPVYGAAPQIDMAAVQLWSNAKTVRYHVEGNFHAWTPISTAWVMGQGDAVDSIVLDFDWNARERMLHGTVTFADGETSVGGVRSSASECPAPVLKGDYEHITVAAITQDEDARLVLKGTRSYAALDAPLQCPASLKLMAAPAATVEATEYLPVPDAMMLAVGATGDSKVTVSADHKTFVVRANGWTWTYTPTRID